MAGLVRRPLIKEPPAGGLDAGRGQDFTVLRVCVCWGSRGGMEENLDTPSGRKEPLPRAK